MTSPTPDQWAQARAAWEAGASNPEAAKFVGVAGETVRNRAKREGWQRNDEEAAKRAAERAERSHAARMEAERKWANRRSTEADAAGITAARARQAIVDALTAKDDKMTRASAIAYGILIDKAQLLSGDATARIASGPSAHDRAVGILDELAQRRRTTG